MTELQPTAAQCFTDRDTLLTHGDDTWYELTLACYQLYIYLPTVTEYYNHEVYLHFRLANGQNMLMFGGHNAILESHCSSHITQNSG
jgi:hypothetical protein